MPVPVLTPGQEWRPMRGPKPLRQKLHAQLLSDRFRLDFMAAKPKAPSISDRNGDRHGGAGLKSRQMVEQEGIITFDAVPSEEDERFLRDDYERLVADVSASQSVSQSDRRAVVLLPSIWLKYGFISLCSLTF